MSGDSFIHQIVHEAHEAGLEIHTRFPPEPNGYLHIGHVKAICLNFDLAREFSGLCNLRMDDTNPTKQYEHYIAQIMDDVRWLGYDWGEHCYHAADHFDTFYQYALRLIKNELAYVDHQSPEEIRMNRGTPTSAGKDSPYRERSVEENLELFQQMKDGMFNDGDCVLRARIDMAADNITMRDPTIYRIRKISHPRSGEKWCLYPMYDFAHCLSDAIEGITHSLCTLEFEDRRPLYNWFLEKLGLQNPPRQIEFARLNISYTILSKRKLARLVEEKHVHGWDDPRMPTIAGMRRRGVPARVLRDFCHDIGITKVESVIDVARMENILRAHLNESAMRRIAIFDPLKLTIVNYSEDQEENFEVVNNPEDETAGHRLLPFSRNLLIESSDFMIDPPKGFFRLSPGSMVRLLSAYCLRCVDYHSDDAGKVVEVFCEYDPETRGGDSRGQKVRATLHWLSSDAVTEARVRLYDRLFNVPSPDRAEDFVSTLNPDSLQLKTVLVEKYSLATMQVGDVCQFIRHGYFVLDADSKLDSKLDSKNADYVFNRVITLRDTWKKLQAKA